MTNVEPLRAELDLSIQEALRAVADLRGDIEEALVGAAGAFEEEFARITGSLDPIELEADASELTPAIDEAVGAADGTVPVEGEGIEQLTLGIEEAVSEADATVVVEADTSDAEAAIGDLGSAAEEAGGGLSSLSGGAAGLQGAAGLAEGSVAGLGSAVGSLGGRAATTVGIVGAIGATVGVFFNEAVDALGATQRFNSVLGDMAGRVENLRDIEGLNTNLGDLALKLGSDDDKLRSVSARLFELARASGIAEKDSSVFTQQMVALGARAVALNPELGDVGDVTDSLSTALVRGGRFASKFGLDLNQADINARALKDTNKLQTEELSFVEKAMAGASLASEKYGKNLDQVVARGAENAITKQRRLKQTIVENFEALGAPLISPIFELMEAGIPITEQLGRVVSILARGALPAITASLKAATPLLELTADVLEAIPGPVLAAASAFLLFRGPVQQGSNLLKSFGGQALSTSDRLGRAAVGVGLAITSFQQAGEAGAQGAIGVAGLAASGALLGSQFGPQGAIIGGVAGAVVGLGKSLFGGGESADEFRGRIAKLSRELQGLSSQRAAVEFLKQVNDAFEFDFDTGKVTANVGNIRKELEQLARVNPGQAQQILVELGKAEGPTALTAQQMTRLADSVNEGSAAYGKQAAKAKEAAAANQEIAAAADTTATAYDRAKAAADTYRASLEQLDAGHTSAFQAETQLATATGALAEAFTTARGSIALNTEEGVKNRDALVSAANQARTYSAAILEAGGSSEAARAPLTGLAGQITDLSTRFGQSPAEIAKLLSSLGLVQFASPEVQAAAAAMGLAVTTEIGGKSEEAAARTAAAMTSAKGAIDNAGLPDAAGRQAKGAVDAFGNPLKAGVPGAVDSATGAAGQVFDRAALKDQAHGAGEAVGRAFSNGVAAGIDQNSGVVADAARYVVYRAKAAADAAARSASPSKLFAELGGFLTEGLALGMSDEVPSVVRAAEDIVRAAAATMPSPPSGTVPGALDPDALGRAIARAMGPSAVTVVRVDTLEEAAEYVPPPARSDPAFLSGRR